MQKGVPNGIQNRPKIGLEPRLASRSNFDQFWGRFWVDFVTILGSFHRCLGTQNGRAGSRNQQQQAVPDRIAKQETNRKAANESQSSKRNAEQQTHRKAANESQSGKRNAKQQTNRKAANESQSSKRNAKLQLKRPTTTVFKTVELQLNCAELR